MKHSENDRFNVELEAFRCYEALLSRIQLIINGKVYKEYDVCLESFKWNESVSIKEDSFIIAKCYDFKGNVAITNPVYIRNAPFVNSGYLSEVAVTVTKGLDPASGYYWLDEEEKTPFEKEIHLKMPVASKLNVQVDGQKKVIRLFELEALQNMFKNLYFGRFNSSRKYRPGEVPAEQFHLKEIREILDKVAISIEF